MMNSLAEVSRGPTDSGPVSFFDVLEHAFTGQGTKSQSSTKEYPSSSQVGTQANQLKGKSFDVSASHC